ncbi:NAD(P)-binding protein [Aaosphaeria arxii CBS 175.79]|uniref:NAD(P)-binding protein n=1 Tax=Aaosphaeria arxii CBS 175.79 TaxID=1450172 RepID=A0A6A5XR80_9PLEO|nr:NAD(P)-binding protein [Aaosphaeria arxii CBS 175.79]KAF2015805.1 NAD(P)-binding protein [Aaosphaeria arxii CBS 175.79]
MSNIEKVLLLGATGETGKDILAGLEEDGGFDISLLVQPSSANTPAVENFRSRGLKIVVADINGPVDDLATHVKGYTTIISAIGATQQLAQLNLADAIAAAGTCKRFVAGWITVSPPGEVMFLRDEKEKVYQRLWYHRIPYTIVDVGFWHQICFPPVPSGKLDYALVMPTTEVYGGGDVKNLLTDKRDIGRFVARIVKDERTLNQKVSCWGEELSQNEIIELVERKTGEKVDVTPISKEDLIARRQKAREAFRADPTSWNNAVGVYRDDYNLSKYIRGDSSRESARYLGYLDAQELYPDFNPIKLEDVLDEILDGKAVPVYQGRF